MQRRRWYDDDGVRYKYVRACVCVCVYMYTHGRVYNRYEGEVLTDFEKDLG